jgi:hypothetical protein
VKEEISSGSSTVENIFLFIFLFFVCQGKKIHLGNNHHTTFFISTCISYFVSPQQQMDATLEERPLKVSRLELPLDSTLDPEFWHIRLICAVDEKNNSIRWGDVRLCLSHDADPMFRNDRHPTTALNKCIAKGDIEVLRIFLEYNVVVTKRPPNTIWPLTEALAVADTCPEILEVLMKEGCRVNGPVADHKAKYPRITATQWEKLEFMEKARGFAMDDALDDLNALVAEYKHEEYYTKGWFKFLTDEYRHFVLDTFFNKKGRPLL